MLLELTISPRCQTWPPGLKLRNFETLKENRLFGALGTVPT
jgi:hypothetical protein